MWTFTKFQNKKLEQVAQRPAGTLKRFFTQPIPVFGMLLFVFLIIGSIIFPLVSQDPMQLNPKERHLSYGVNGHILGTDFMGRDIWSRLWSGFGLSLKITMFAVLADVVIGVVVGTLMGYFDAFYKLMNGVIKVISSIPSILYMILIAMILTPSVYSIAFGLAITAWISMGRQVASKIRVVEHADFVTASNALATPSYKIALSLVKFALPLILTQMVFTVAATITADSALAVIGLKIIGKPSLGGLLSDGTKYFVIFPHEIVSPLVIIFTTKISIILMSNGITEAQRRTR